MPKPLRYCIIWAIHNLGEAKLQKISFKHFDPYKMILNLNDHTFVE
jgi:hypothetical protein